MRILVIENDSVSSSQAIKHLIRRIGHGVDMVTYGIEARSMLQQQSYDLILLDLNLPDTNGTNILTHLRLRKSNTPVLVVKRRDQVKDLIRLLDLDADDYTAQLFNFGKLEKRIRALLRGSAGHELDLKQREFHS